MSQRFEYIDILKAIAIIFVVIGHVLSGCKCESIASWDDIIMWKFIYSFHMPLFMFISGFVCFNPDKNYALCDIVKRVVSYLIPFVVIDVMLGVLRGEFSMMTMWYFRTLSIYVVSLYIGKEISRLICRKTEYHILRSVIVALFFYIIVRGLRYACNHVPEIDVVLDRQHMMNLYMYFLTGWGVREFKNINKYIRNDYALVLSLISVFVLYGCELHTHLQAFAMIIMLINICSLDCLVNSKVLKVISENTKAVYIIHLFLLFKLPQAGEWFSSYSSFAPIYQAIPQLIYAIPISGLSIWLSVKVATLIKESPLMSLLILGDIKAITKFFVKK